MMNCQFKNISMLCNCQTIALSEKILITAEVLAYRFDYEIGISEIIK